VSVDVGFAHNSGGGTLSGTTTAPTNASGRATFSDLSIDKASPYAAVGGWGSA